VKATKSQFVSPSMQYMTLILNILDLRCIPATPDMNLTEDPKQLVVQLAVYISDDSPAGLGPESFPS